MDYRTACLQAGICVKDASGENLDNTVVTGEKGVRSVLKCLKLDDQLEEKEWAGNRGIKNDLQGSECAYL